MTGAQVEAMLASGELALLAKANPYQPDFCAALGLAPHSYRAMVARARRVGRPFPSFAELSGIAGRKGGSCSTVAEIDAVIGEGFVQGKADASWRNRGAIDGNAPHREVDGGIEGALGFAAEIREERAASNPDFPAMVDTARAKRWPHVEAFEANHMPAVVDYDPPFPIKPRSFVHLLSESDMPSGSIVGVISDIHIPHHDDHAMRLVVECLEDAGVTHIILNGDIADCGPASRHPGKRQRAMLNEGDLRSSVAPGMWIYDWARTKNCTYVLGNHEAWVTDLIEGSPELRGTAATELMGLPRNGDGWLVLPPLSRVRRGSRVWEHLDGLFKSGSGGQNPGQRIKKLAPEQTTSGGHLHRKGSLFWTSLDEHGIERTRAAYWNGHLSRPEAHAEYMGSYMDWQQSFEITRVWDDEGKPRFTTDQPEIHRTKQGRPIFEYGGKVYGR